MQNLNKEKVHFPGLNSLRFFAALSVLIGHVELMKFYMDLPNLYNLFERINFGGIGVYFFFVLSGFLITYLLCLEKETEGGISVKNFYVRRILRIWPLYFFILVLGFFILPATDFFNFLPGSFTKNFNFNLVCFLLILPNLAFAFNPPVPHISQSWSIGVEEQFYIFWPWIMKGAKNITRTIILFTIIYFIMKVGVAIVPHFFKTGPQYIVLQKFFAMNKFESMMIGGWGAAILYLKKEKILKIIYHPLSLISSIILFPVISFLVYGHGLLQDGIHIPLSVLFLIIILNVSSNKSSIIKLEIKAIDYLGRISYGIYMYHLIVIFAVVKIFKEGILNNSTLINVLVYILSVGLSCLLAHVSYISFEKYFIGLKKKVTKINNG